MLVLTAGSRRLIDSAIDRLPNAQQRAEWRAWANANPDIRHAGGAHHNDRPNIPSEIIAIAMLALEIKYADLMHDRDQVDEDDRYSFDNDLSFISAIKKSLVAEAA